MELLYRHSDSRLWNTIRLLLVVCSHFKYSMPKNLYEKAFTCTANVFDRPTTSYINCTFNVNFTGQLYSRCYEMHVDGVVVIVIDNGHKDSQLKDTNKTLEMSSPTFRCVSNIAANIRAEVDEGMDLAHFTDFSRSRIFSPSLKETQYILDVRLLEFKNYLNSWMGQIKYQIFPNRNPMSKINILIGDRFTDYMHKGGNCSSPQIAFCGKAVCRHNISLTTLLVQKFVEIPIPSVSVRPLIFKEICKFKSNISSCGGKVKNPPVICLPVQEFKIKLESRSKTVAYNGSIYKNNIPFSLLPDTLKLKNNNLQIVDIDNFSDREMDKLAKSFQNQTDKPFVVSMGHKVSFKELKRFMTYLNSSASENCDPHQTLNFDQLQFALQLLGVAEILVAKKEELSFTPSVGFTIRSQILLDYGPGNYIAMDFCGRVFPISIDFSPHPYSILNDWPNNSKYDIFTGELTQNSMTFSCPFTTMNGTIILGSSISNTTTVIRHATLSKRHEFRSFSVAHVHSPENFNDSSLSCKGFAPSSKINGLIDFNYVPTDDTFFCKGREVNLNHWKCKNRIQCEAAGLSCIQDIKNEGLLPHGSRMSTDVFREDGSRLITDGVAYKPFCMDTLHESNIGRCNNNVSKDAPGIRKYCKTTKPSAMGIIQCIANGAFGTDLFELDVIYFRGLDGVLYFDAEMKGPPTMEAVLKMTTASNQSIFYTKEKYKFFCEAHSFFYDDGIRWLLKYENGTTHEPADEIVSDDRNRNDAVFNSKSELTLTLPDSSLKEVICLAPYFNNLNFSNVSITTDILESTPPSITSVNTDIGFTVDATDQSLSCVASGRPLPKISWKRYNEEIKKPVRILEGNTLFFSIYNATYSGEYVCTATNIAGSDTKTFKVQERKIAEKNDTTMFAIVGAVTSLIIFLSILFLIYLTNERLKRYREMREIINLLNGSKTSNEKGDEVEEEAFHTNFLFDTKYDIQKNTFIVDERILLGKGEFGEVYRGLLQHRNEAVAFKTVRRNAGIQHLKALVSEAKILMYIGSHDHLVTLLGVYRREIKSGIIYVAIEYCELGSLESFLRKNHKYFEDGKILNTKPNSVIQSGPCDRRATQKKIPAEDELIKSLCTVNNLLVWSEEIANAMEYLGTKNVIHSDLATRNVLLTSTGSAKVTDFGLSRRTYSYSEYIKTAKDPLPWRWLAIESLRTNTFSAKSDVWAYGILLWEIFSLGDLPYPGMSPTMEFVQELENGLQNCKPKWASDEIYNIMIRCWHLDPEQRPTFSSIGKIFNHAIGNGWSALSDEVASEMTLEDIVVKLASKEYLEL